MAAVAVGQQLVVVDDLVGEAGGPEGAVATVVAAPGAHVAAAAVVAVVVGVVAEHQVIQRRFRVKGIL